MAALLLGPSGVGLIGLFQNLISTASGIASLGFGNVGTRQIAEAVGRGDPVGIAAARRALFWGTLFLAFLGASIFWLLRNTLASHILGSEHKAGEIGWLAVGVIFTVAAGSQGALLNGLRRVGDIARVSVSSAIFSTALGIGALWLWGARGLTVFVLSAPFASFVMGHLYVAQLPKVQTPRTSLSELMLQWRTLVRLGSAFMLAGVAITLGQLAVRTMVQYDLGAESLGQFQAAWTISMTYIGFVLGAMGTDYYPRLAASIHDHAAVNRMANEQTEVALLLAGPVFLAMLALAPWLMELLYSSKFAEAALILRWQVLGDVLKVASWPMGFIIVASGDGRTFMLTQSLFISVFVGLVWISLPLVGVQSTGLAFLGMYVIGLPLNYWLARRRTGFAWSREVARQFAALTIAAVGVSLLARWSLWGGVILGLPASLIFGINGFNRLAKVAELSGNWENLANICRVVLKKVGARRG